MLYVVKDLLAPDALILIIDVSEAEVHLLLPLFSGTFCRRAADDKELTRRSGAKAPRPLRLH